MFIAHGEFRLRKEGQIILIDSKGPFNNEAVTQFTQDIHDLIQSYNSPWGQIITLHQDSIFTPQAESSMKSALYSRKNLGLVASAIIITNHQASFVIRHQISGVYDEVGIAHIYTDSEKTAREWVNRQIAAL